jgi:probable phosphoglycerate mutase
MKRQVNNRETEIILVRHGETAWNAEGRIQGHLDIALNDIGLAQAAAVGSRLRRERFDAIYSSDLARAFETARPIVNGADRIITRDARLRERHLGILQGLTGEEAMAGQPHAWHVFKARHVAEPLEDGESLGAFATRALEFLDRLVALHPGGRVIVVTHGGVLDAAYRRAMAMPLSAPRDFPIYNASINVLRHGSGEWKIESWADVSHLPQELSMDDT